jgi:hypothetical protein
MMPKFRVSIERPAHESRSVVVEADDADDAKHQALTAEFDEAQLDGWEPGDPGPAEVYDVEEVDADEPLTPLAAPLRHSAELSQIVWSITRHEQDGPCLFNSVYPSQEAAEAAIAEDLEEWPGLTRADYTIQDHQVEAA